jgi:hypothetical protein
MAIDYQSLTDTGLSILIGAVKVNKPFVWHNASYECAAWWEDSESEKGVHPVYLGRNYHYPKNLTLTAHIKAKVTDDYFPGLWGGVRISNEPYKPKHIGEDRTIRHGIEVLDAIQSTGSSPGSDLDWFIHPSWWRIFTEEAIANLREDYRRLPEFWEPWDKLDQDPASYVPRSSQKDLRWSFDDEYRSKVGMIAHFGMNLDKWARRIEKINWHSQYHKAGSSYDTAYQRDNFAKNTEWTKAIQIQVNQ